MNRNEQRTVEELITRYRHEPTLRDVYVEGETDKGVFDWSFDAGNKRDVAVYEISSVYVPVEKIFNLGLKDNNRGRVITLAHLLWPHLAPGSNQVTCIADKDLDIVLGVNHSIENLLFTDYTCIEMYMYTTRHLSKFLNLSARINKNPETVLQEFTPVLENLFLARLANETLGWGLTSIPFTNYCSNARTGLRFDFATYLRNYLATNGRGRDLERFNQEIERFRERLTTDARFQIQGHDFTFLLSWYIGQLRPGLRQIFDAKTTERTLVTSLDEHVLDEGLFTSLLHRL